ncbi:MAG: type II secretion system secretin GspD, partial [Gallionella sp.]|nr:type II secretion system secretin GspD [Gallionella sp.]
MIDKKLFGLVALLLWGTIALKPLHAADFSQGSLNFVEAEIESVIAAIGDYTHTTFIIDPRVKGTISLVSEKPLSKAQAFQLLTSALRLRGYSVVSANGYSKVVPEADAKLQGGIVQSRSGASGDQIVTQVFHLNYESSTNMVNVLRPLISPNNTINANPGNNTLVITDYADNLLRLNKIIQALDSPANSDVEVVPVRNAIANDVASMVNKLLEPSGTPADAGRVNLLVDTRSNAIIVRAPSEARANLAKSLIAKLDQPTALPGNVHVVYLKNAEATKLAQTLRAVVSTDNAASNFTPAANAPQTQVVSLPSGGSAGYIQADAATNTLIITANDTLYRNLRSIIDQLDARRAQVYIEALIVEVDNSKLAELGVQWAARGGSNNVAGGGTSFSTGGNNLMNQLASKTPLPLSNGLNLGMFSSKLGLGALVHALESDTKTNILSMPNIITLDNEEAKIIVGQNVPFVTGQYTTAASGGSAGVNPFQTVERKDIGLTLRVKPQISEGGTVKMAIYQENSSISPTVNSAGLITNKRSIDTNIIVDDGQIIVLGGLIDDKANDTNDRVPVLGDIPFIGGLFKYRSRTREKTNLMVFLRPTVIRNNEQSVSLATDRYDYIRNAELNAQPIGQDLMPNMGTPLL